MERKELHRRVEILKNNIEEGKVKVAPHLIDNFNQSLSKIRILSDGIIDTKSVDGRIRSMCLMATVMNDRKEWKESVSLFQIQEAYFQRVDYAFGDLYNAMIKYNSDPYKFAAWYISDINRLNDCIEVVNEFISAIKEFWMNISEPTWIHLEDSFDSKAIFTGELFPDGYSNVASSTGIYFDTTILPDPFIKIINVLPLMNNSEKCYDVIRLGLQVLSYKEITLLDIDKPIIAILPDRQLLEKNYTEFVNNMAIIDSIKHTKTLFGEDINDEKELMDYFSHFKDSSDIVKKLQQPNKLIFWTDLEGSLNEHIDRYLQTEGKRLGISKPGHAVYMHLISRFSQANDAFQKSVQLRGTPIIRAETSWVWYKQMLEYSAGNSSNESINDLHIARALNSTTKSEIPWIGNIPADSLIELRKIGALDEIRAILKKDIHKLIEVNPENFHRTGDQVFSNLNTAFKDHEKKIKELVSKKWTFAGKDISSFLVVGGIELAAALTGLPTYGAVATAANMTGVIPTAKDLKEKYKQLSKEEREFNRTGIGILLKNKE